jgi:hypothetical protein
MSNHLNECNNCPDGYTYDPNTQQCVLVETINASYTGSLVTVGSGDKSRAYSYNGARLYEPISSSQIPILPDPAGTTNSTWQLLDNTNTPIPINTSILTNSLWGTPNALCDPTVNGGGRLNTVGVWVPGYPNNTQLIFEVCINIDEEKQYLIGIGGDNEVSLYVNNVLYIELGGDPLGSATIPYTTWHVFPITIPAGQTVIKLAGVNFGGDAAFGAEIYDITFTDFQNTLLVADSGSNCGNVPADIQPYLLFSTQDMIGRQVPNPQVFPGEWQCPVDPENPYTLDNCDGTVQCTRTLIEPPEACCYRVKDCEGEEEFIVGIFEECASQISTLEIGSVWTFDLVESCGSTPLVQDKCYEVIAFENPCSIKNVCTYCPVEQKASCDDCTRCYACTNCSDPGDVIYFNWAPPPAPPLDVNQTYRFNFDTERCWTCEETQSPCIAPTTLNYTYSICTGEAFIIDNVLQELVANTGTYTYEFYIDPTFDTLWSGSTNNYLPIGLPDGYTGSVLTLYVLIYLDGCSVPGQSVLSLEWNNDNECTNCGPPRVNNRDVNVCDCDDNGVEFFDLTTYNNILPPQTHPYVSSFVLTWFADSLLTLPVADPTSVIVPSGSPVTYYLRVSYTGCQQEFVGQGSLTLTLLPSTDPECIETCG